MPWLLDTNVWIHYLKNPNNQIQKRLAERHPEEVVTCAVVKAELLLGARKYGVPERRLAVIEKMLAPYLSLPFDDAAAEHYARIRHELETEGRNIGPYDLQIAAICLANDCVLVTANLNEFKRVSGLRVENWQS